MISLPDRAHEFAGAEIDVAVMEQEVNELKSKLNKIGEVNLSSI